MKLSLSLNAINLIVTGAMSAGVVGATTAAIIDSNIESENLEVMNEAEAVEELEIEDTAEEKPDGQEEHKESIATQDNMPTQPNTNIAPSISNSTPNTPKPTPATPAPTEQETSNITGLPDTISRYEWARQGGWAKLVEAAYFKAVNRGATAMYNGADWSVKYYQIVAMATDPCYASIYVELEVDGETKMAVTSADLIAAPGVICDSMRPQVIDIPTLPQLTDYLQQVETKYGLYQKIKGSSKR